MDQIIHLFHYLFSMFLLLILVPGFFFQKQYHGAVEQITANFIKMAFILLAIGYVLVILKLFELLSVVFLLAFIGSRIYGFRNKDGSLGNQVSNLEAVIYDFFEGKSKPIQLFSFYAAQQYQNFKALINGLFSTPARTVETVSLLIVLCFALYIRLNDAIMHSAPSFMDQYTTLKWVKDIKQSLLFSDGITPQGFHVFWSVIQEFSRIDTLYMTKFSGPFIQIFIMLGIYIVLSLLTGSRIPGVVGLAVYALLGEYADPYFREWQVVAAPGPFAHIFFLPTLYYLVLYLRDGHRDAFYTMFAGMGVIAFVHPVVFLELLFFVGAVILWAVVVKMKKERASVKKVIYFAGIAGGLSLVPVIAGFIYQWGLKFSIYEFLQIESESSFYLLPLPSLAPLVVSTMIGVLWYFIFKWFWTWQYHSVVERCMLGGAIIAALSFTTLQPIEPVKVDWDSSVAQYEAISNEISPLNWMIVSKQSFTSVVQGRGYHMNIEILVNEYDPSQKSLTRIGFDEPDVNVPPHVFIFYEKSLRPIQNKQVMDRLKYGYYDRWVLWYQELKHWIDQYIEKHPEVEVYYEDEYIIIYHLEREQSKGEIQKQIWGEGGI